MIFNVCYLIKNRFCTDSCTNTCRINIKTLKEKRCLALSKILSSAEKAPSKKLVRLASSFLACSAFLRPPAANLLS